MKNLFMHSLATALFIMVAAVQLIAQEQFAYQAVIRDNEGNLVTQGKVGLKFSLTNGGKTYYVETQNATPDQYGNVSVIIGETAHKVSGSMADVPWNTLDITLKVEVDAKGGTNYKLLGETKLTPAPYALYAPKGGGAATVGSATKDGATLFEVNDRNGNPVFAVTDNGIVVYVDDTDNSDKARRSGFLIVGRDASKGESEKEYFSVTADGTQIHVDGDDSKVRRSGFYITGRESKGGQDEYLTVDGKGTTVYVDANGEDKVRRSGFYITGRDADKSADNNMFAVDGGQTSVYVDDLSNGKVRRSGFLIVGRDSKDGNGIVDINGSQTNLTTATLSVVSSAANEEGPASTALQLTETAVTMNSDMAMEGGLRPALDVDKNEEYNIYISDNEDDDPDGFDRIYINGNFSFSPYQMVKGYYRWLASFHDTLVVPLISPESILMLNSDGEETAIPQDACVAVFFPDRYSDYINVWPLRKLDNFKVSFALTDYDISYGAILGYADEYARLNVTISSKAAYPGCWLYLGGPQVYTAKVETSQGTFEVETGGNYNKEYRAVLGETVTLAVTKVPDGQVFDSWRCNGRRYTDSVLHLPITQMETEIYPVFKDVSPVLWVNNNYNGNVTLGTENAPYKTIAEAFSGIIDENDNVLRGWRINVEKSNTGVINVGDSLNNYAKHITIDFTSRNYGNRVISGINVSTAIPVIVRNAEVVASTNGDAVKLSGKRLTLDGCNVSKNANTVRGLNVEKGELVMIGGTVRNCNNRGAYVAEDATLSLKNGAEISGNTIHEGAGGGIYLCGGATLNVNNSNINENNEVYAAGNECSFNVSSSQIANVYLDNAAFVSVTLDEGVEDKTMYIGFSKIATPTSKVVELKGKIDERFVHELQYSFIINDENLLNSDYSKYLKFEGNIGYPFITKKIYTKGTISFTNEDAVSYTYYRNDNEDEYLRLKYEYSSGETKYQNYWFVDNGKGKKLYRDTTYICEDGEDPMPFTEVENDFFDPVDSDGNPLAVEEFVVPEGFTLNDNGDIVPNANQNFPVMRKEKNIVVECSRAILFTKNLGNLMDLLEFESYDAFSSLTASETKFGDYVYFSDDADDFRNYSQWEIEEHFDKLRKGFDVTIIALGGTVTDGDGKNYSGITHLENVAYNTPLTLTAQQGENKFIGWSDGVSEGTSTRTFIIRGDVEIMPIFKQTDFTVSADGPYESINMVGKYLENSLYTNDDNVTIKVKGIVKGPQTLSNKINVGSITIDGVDGDNPNGVLDARSRGRVLTINTTSPITISNLTITGGYAGENGGGIMMAEGTDVTLADGAMIAGNETSGSGGGVYNEGTLLMTGTAQIGKKDNPNKASKGGGIYNKGTVYLGNEENELTGGIFYNNTSDAAGAGIYIDNDATVVMNSGYISYNSSQGPYAYGQGVCCDGTFTMNNGEISHNSCGEFTSGSIFLNGGGVLVGDNGTFNMNNGLIVDNMASNGGGVYVKGVFNFSGGVIKENKAYQTKIGGTDKRGSGIFIEQGTFSISGSAYVPKCTTENNDPTMVNNSNDIYVEDRSKHNHQGTNIITIAGKLTPPDEANGIVATITPETYAASAQVLKYELADGQTETNLADECGKFEITQSDVHTYSIDNGKLIPDWMVEADGHYYVELGTSKTKWATTNVESDTPYGPGGYYMWGLPSSATSGFTLNNYNNYANSMIESDLGNYQQDPARKHWGNNWVMPSKAQFDNLKTECYWEWTNNYDGKNVKGFIVYNPKEGSSDAGTVSLSANSNYVLADAHIFLPAAGYYDGNTKSNESSSGHYWTLTYYSSQYAYYMNLTNSGSVTTDLGYRYRGLTVRPVRRE